MALKEARKYETSLCLQFSLTSRAEPNSNCQNGLTSRAEPNSNRQNGLASQAEPKIWPKRLVSRAYYEPSLGSFQL